MVARSVEGFWKHPRGFGSGTGNSECGPGAGNLENGKRRKKKTRKVISSCGNAGDHGDMEAGSSVRKLPEAGKMSGA